MGYSSYTQLAYCFLYIRFEGLELSSYKHTKVSSFSGGC